MVGRHKNPSPASDPGTAGPHRTCQVTSVDGGSGHLETGNGPRAPRRRRCQASPSSARSPALIASTATTPPHRLSCTTAWSTCRPGQGCAMNQSDVEREPEHAGAIPLTYRGNRRRRYPKSVHPRRPRLSAGAATDDRRSQCRHPLIRWVSRSAVSDLSSISGSLASMNGSTQQLSLVRLPDFLTAFRSAGGSQGSSTVARCRELRDVADDRVGQRQCARCQATNTAQGTNALGNRSDRKAGIGVRRQSMVGPHRIGVSVGVTTLRQVRRGPGGRASRRAAARRRGPRRCRPPAVDELRRRAGPGPDMLLCR